MKLSIALILILILASCKKEVKSKVKIETQTELEIEKTKITKEDTIQAKYNSIIKPNIPDFVDLSKIPDTLELKGLNLSGDFNANGKADFASIVLNKKDGQKGVIIVHNSEIPKYYVFGAGKEVNGMTDLRWIGVFKKIPKGETVTPTIVDEKTGDIIEPDEKQVFKLIGDGIYMYVEESHGGGILFWNGNEYQWYHIE